ncbi:multiple epidermal growth factor-like domains protein 10 [Ostrea edulis]|uniref:multiple epidermal growth factor-like domains protein 10 n=1 Tax=Ostrea edulis TaxID=37623 RepID=UPI0024AF033B|nr:multiple epidermal growth factor-like domains protein 10 [Ostrea edulis]XP_048741393.2 multiple epidermal growth factor-like domains protein 10 [Ostrea edulis]
MTFSGIGTLHLCLSLALIGAYDNLSKGRKSFVYDGDGGEVFRKFFRENASVITDGDPTTCFPSYYFRYLYRNKTTLNVDMATLQSIYQVDIFQGEVSSNWSVYISTTDRRDNATQCTRTISSPDVQRFTCADHGRFVILAYVDGNYKKRDSICVVNVTGCTVGKFGEDCSKNCPENCKGKICHILDGRCTMCFDGWKGDYCNQRKQNIQETGKCTDGYFGDNCTKLCKGRCLNGAACNAVTGYCDEGCAPGWRNLDCSEVCLNGFFGTKCAQRCNLSCDPITGIYSGTVTEMLGKSGQSSEGSPAIVSGLIVALFVSVLMNVGLLAIYWKRGILKGKQTCLKEAPLYANAEFDGPVHEQPGRGDSLTGTTVCYETLDDRTRDQDTQNYSTLDNERE